MSSPRIPLTDVVPVSVKPTPADVLLTPQPDNYEVKIAYHVLVKKPYHEVTDVMSFVTDFFPFISGAEYEYPPTFPRDKLEEGNDSSLLNQTFKVQKKGMEAEPSCYKYQRANYSYSPEMLSLITIQLPGGDKNTFKYFYNAIQCTPDADGNAILHDETGYTATMLTRNFGAGIAEAITGNTLVTTLDRINLWFTNPIEALQQRIIRMNLLRLNPPTDKDKPIEYTSTTRFACSTQQVMDVLRNTRVMVDDVLMCEMRSPSYKRFAKTVPCVEDIELELKTEKPNSFLFAKKSKTIDLSFNKLSIELSVGESKPDAGAIVSVTTQGSFVKANLSEMRVYFKEWMADQNAKMTGRLATIVKKTHSIEDVTPDLNSTDSVPDVLRSRLGFRS